MSALTNLRLLILSIVAVFLVSFTALTQTPQQTTPLDAKYELLGIDAELPGERVAGQFGFTK